MGRWELEGYTDKCIRMLNDHLNPKYIKADKRVPLTLLRNCEGICFITIFKAGLFFLGGNMGAGCVIAKVKDDTCERGWRWSGPSAVACGGLGGGFIWGAEKIDSMIILNTKGAVRAMMGSGQVTLGGNVSLAAGPLGREIEAHAGVSKNKEIVAAYSYSKAQGLYIGATLEGAFLVARNKDNIKYYGDQGVTPERILNGDARCPLKVDALHRELYNIHDRKGNYEGLESTASMHQPGDNSSTSNLGPMQEEKLQPHWQKVATADGTPYYHNTVTNETRWEAPLVVAPQPSTQSSFKATSAPVANSQAPIQDAIPVAVQAPIKPASSFVAKSYDSSSQAQASAVPPRPISQRPIAARPSATPQAIALYPYQAARGDEVTFNAQDRIEILDKSDPNWFKVRVNGAVGMAPSNYIQLI